MSPRESRIIVVRALRWSRAYERRLNPGDRAPMKLFRERERELLKACAAISGLKLEAPSAWQRLVNRALRLVRSNASGRPVHDR